MSETATRAVSAQPSIDFSSLPRPSRTLLKRLHAYPSWLAEGWANPSDEHLREAGEYRDKRPIQRARKALVDLGLVEHRKVRRGELLPNGERARWPHWIYVAGPGLHAPASNDVGGGGELEADERCEKGTATAPEWPKSVPFWPPRSVDPDDSTRVRSSATPEPPPESFAEREEPTSKDFSGSENEPSTVLPPPPIPDVATSVLACRVAQYFAAATGHRWPRVHDDVIAYLTPFLDGMNGDAISKVERACRVIDAAARESTGRPPSLRFVFHPQMYWKRLTALTDPRAKPLAKAARRPADAPGPRNGPNPPPPPRSFSKSVLEAPAAGEELVDPAAMTQACAVLEEEPELEPYAPPRPASSSQGRGAEPAARPVEEDGAADPVLRLLAGPAIDPELEELAETMRVRNAVWDREREELEIREALAEEEKHARWRRLAMEAREQGSVDGVDEFPAHDAVDEVLAPRPRANRPAPSSPTRAPAPPSAAARSFATGVLRAGAIERPKEPSRFTGNELAELEALREADHLARTRCGQPPRYPPRAKRAA